ncbi:MAG: hypothetical protein VW338_14110 [Rhodospirillaceae bacterium]
MATDPDWTDPCAVLTWLRPQYYKVAAGVSTVSVSHDGVSVSYNQASLDKLAALMRRLESDCAVASGGARKRRAIVAG